jgi:hypothetical protein
MADAANRKGELKTRVNVIRHGFETRCLPSMPQKGFSRETRPIEPTCSPTP